VKQFAAPEAEIDGTLVVFPPSTPFASYTGRKADMVMTEGFPAPLVIVFAVLWALWFPVVVVVALIQRRTIPLAILFGMLLGPFGFYLFPRLSPRKPKSPGW
jgi:hypothetical protein